MQGWPLRHVLWPLLSTLSEAHRHATSTGDARILMEQARDEVFRPIGFCPPRDEENDGGEGEEGEGGEEQREMEIIAIDAVIGSGGGSGQGVELAKRATSMANSVTSKIRASVSGGVSAAVFDSEIMTSAKSGNGAAAVGASFQELRDTGRKATKGAGRRRKLDWVSRGGDMVDGVPEGYEKDRLTRVIALDEPWQSMYLWSLLFVKTTSDSPLFDHRAVRLFEVG